MFDNVNTLAFNQIWPGHAIVLGVDALFIFLSRFINNSELTREKYPNAVPDIRFTNLTILRIYNKTIS